MPPEDKEKLNRIEDMKRRIFSNSYQTRIEYKDGFSEREEKEVPESWSVQANKLSNSEKLLMKTSIFKKFFVFSIVFFILAVGYLSYMFFVSGNVVSNKNIDISILGNTFTAGGEDISLQIEIINKNTTALDLVDLVVEYPKGSSSDSLNNTERIRTSIGTIPSGGVYNENMKIVLFGEQGSVQQVKISLEYRVENSNAIFVKEKLYEITINSTPINLSVEAPNEASPNQDITLNIKSTLNATRPASKILIKVEYPTGFQFISATPSPTLENNVWDLGDLSPGAESNIAIVGRMIDVFDGEEKTFRIFSGSQSSVDKSNIGVVYNSLGQTILIKKPFIEAKLFVNGIYQREYAINSNTSISGTIRWVNNLDTKINDLEIRAKISGNAFGRKVLDTSSGFYNSLEDSIIWNKNYDDDFSEVNPSESGAVSFSVATLPTFSASDGMLVQPYLNIDVSISGKQPIEGNIVKNLINSESKKIRIISNVGMSAKALYFSGPFKNTGAIPPKAETETTYTIVWGVSNTSNNISKAQIRSTLPPWIKFVGTVFPTSEDVNYNPSTREIVWNIGSIPRGAGITQAGREVAFQISFTPSLSQVNSLPILINSAFLTGHDDFANVDVNASKGYLTTRLNSDPDFTSSGSIVVE